MTIPAVSVVMPTHNRAGLVGRAIASVLAQTHRDLELIVVDDASSDETPAVVRAFGDPRLRYVRLDQSRRAAGARNLGASLARGPFLAFQDDDDVWLIGKLERQLAFLQASGPGTALCLCEQIRFGADSAAYVPAPGRNGLDFARGPLGGFGIIATPGWLMPSAAFAQSGGFDERLRSWDDWELAYRLSQIGRIVTIAEPLFLQDRSRGGFMWSNQSVFPSDMAIILEKHAALWTGRPRELAQQYYTMGRTQARFGPIRDARQSLRRALSLDPGHWRALAVLALTALGAGAVHAAARAWQGVKA